ncbi:MAG: YebC/PmpR family DNA-binding transcriptional regulator [Patescibacteria group bacterium]
MLPKILFPFGQTLFFIIFRVIRSLAYLQVRVAPHALNIMKNNACHDKLFCKQGTRLMSGHSKWSQIKHKKGVTDQKRGALFSKLIKAISVAARDNPKPDANPRLRSAIEKARENNVPNENIERAIHKSSDTEKLSEVVIEAYGPEKSAFIIEGITDNTNRTIAEIKQILGDHDMKMAGQGSVLWSFEKTDSGWKPQFSQSISPEAHTQITEAIEALEDHDDIQRVTTNASL